MKWPVASVSLVLGENTGKWGIPTPTSALPWSQAPLCPPLRGLCHEVVIETALALGQPAADDMLILLRHLLLNVHLHSAEQKGPQNLNARKQEADGNGRH